MTDDSHIPNSDTTIEHRPYLGDPKVLDKLLRNIAREGVNCRIAVGQGILSSQDADLIDEKETRNAAAILLGRNRQYAIDTNWNIPGVIDSFVAKELSIDSKGPEDILASGFNKFLAEIHDRLETVNMRQLDADWEKRIGDIFEKYRNIYLGISGASASPESVVVTSSVAPLTPPPAPSTAVPPPNSTPAPEPPRPTHISAAVPTVDTPVKPKGSPALKLVAAAILLLLLISGGVYMLRKPAPAPSPQATAPTPPPPPPKPAPVTGATAILKDGKILLLDEKGNTFKTVALKNESESIIRLFDLHLEPGREQYLIGKAIKIQGEEDPVGHDLWLLNEAGDERLVNSSVMHARLSPDGSKLAYSTTEAILEIEDTKGESLGEVPGVFEPTWRKDNEVVFLMVPEGRAIWPPEALSIATYDLATKSVAVLTDGRFDDTTLEYNPAQKWLLLTAGAESGLPSFWKLPAGGGEPEQITNVRLNETGNKWVPTPWATSLWSKDGRWFLYDFKDGHIEQVWGIEFDDNGGLKRAVHLTDGLFPRWLSSDSFICMKRQGDTFEMATQKLP